MSPHVAVVIVGYRNAGDIVRCLAALEKSTYRNFEVVICENGGGEAFAALRSQLPPALPNGQTVILIQAPSNRGYASGINIAMAGSREADAWWILNPDTEPSPGAMAALVARFAQGYDAVGGPIYFPSGEIQSFGGVWSAWRAKGTSLGYGAPAGTKPDTAVIERTQNYLSGASMFVGRTFVAVAGQMEERYFLYCEEVDWFLRANTAGLASGLCAGGDRGSSSGNHHRLWQVAGIPVGSCRLSRRTQQDAPDANILPGAVACGGVHGSCAHCWPLCAAGRFPADRLWHDGLADGSLWAGRDPALGAQRLGKDALTSQPQTCLTYVTFPAL